MLLNKKCKGCNSCYKPRELEHMLQLPMTMRSVIRSHRTTGTSLIIVVRLHAFKTAAQFLSALAQKFQLRRKARRTRWSILDWACGWIAYWSLGNCALAVKIIVGLIRKLNLTESVFETLTPIATKREVETSRCVTSQRYLVVLLLSFSWNSGALLYPKVQLLVQGLFTGARAWAWLCITW